MVNFVAAVAYHFCLAWPAAFTQPGDHLLAKLCRQYFQFCSRRQKFLNSPTTRSLNPFPSVTQLNMKELLVSLSDSTPPPPPPMTSNLAVSTANITTNPVRKILRSVVEI